METKQYKTDQEEFWAGSFGKDYIERNQGADLLAANLNFFAKALLRAGPIASVTEFGANIGMNLKALKLLYPRIRAKAIEINPEAAEHLKTVIGNENTYCGSMLDYDPSETTELALIKGVLIHTNPDHLNRVYDLLYKVSTKYVLVCEYYNPSPVAIPYRGHNDRLFKRDFAGEMLEKFKSLKLIDYGFAYRRDPAFPQDDITWFLMQKEF